MSTGNIVAIKVLRGDLDTEKPGFLSLFVHELMSAAGFVGEPGTRERDGNHHGQGCEASRCQHTSHVAPPIYVGKAILAPPYLVGWRKDR